MTTIIATIKPWHLRNIRLGKKTYEIRKTCPKEAPFKVLCCESGSGGQIKAEFICTVSRMNYIPNDAMLEAACISRSELEEYENGKRGLQWWDISNMIDYCSTKGYHIRNISEFGLKRAPQSWQYVKEEP